MTNEKPAACSLDASRLERRLVAIAEVGADSLVSHAVDGDGRHLLRFRPRAGTRDRLEGSSPPRRSAAPSSTST